MKHLYILGGILLALALLTGLSAGQRRQDKATVHIVVVNGFGLHLGEAEVESFKSMDGGQDFSRHFLGGTAKDIPYGDYQVRVHKTGFYRGQMTAQVFQPDVWVVVGLMAGGERGEYQGPTVQMTGTVKNIDPSEQPVYIRLAAVYSNFMMDTRVNLDQSGTFTLAGVIPNGEYVLLTIGRTRILDMRQLKVASPAKEPIMIDLAPIPGKVVLRGTVENIDPDEPPVHIKLMGAYSDFKMGAGVYVREQSGTFVLGGIIPDGEYILLTVGPKRVLDVRKIKVGYPAKEPIVIDLKPAADKKEK